jgi:hypothetical protein
MRLNRRSKVEANDSRRSGATWEGNADRLGPVEAMAMIVTILMVVVMIVAVMKYAGPSLWSNAAGAVVRTLACSANVD